MLTTVIAWQRSGDSECPYVARCGELELAVRINDFPAEPLYTLIINGKDAADLENWPVSWTKSPPA